LNEKKLENVTEGGCGKEGETKWREEDDDDDDDDDDPVPISGVSSVPSAMSVRCHPAAREIIEKFSMSEIDV